MGIERTKGRDGIKEQSRAGHLGQSGQPEHHARSRESQERDRNRNRRENSPSREPQQEETVCGVSSAMCWVFDFRQATEPSESSLPPGKEVSSTYLFGAVERIG